MTGICDARIEQEILARVGERPLPFEELAVASRGVAGHALAGEEGALHAIVHRLVRGARLAVVGRSPTGSAVYGRVEDAPVEGGVTPIPPPASAKESRLALAVASKVRAPEDRGRVVSDVLAHRAALAAAGRLSDFGSKRGARDLLRRVDRRRGTIAVPDGPWERKVRLVRHEGPSIVTTILVLAFVYFFVAEFRVVPTNSMQPTIKPGDRLLVYKWDAHRAPERFEMLVFAGPEEFDVDEHGKPRRIEGRVLVKRVAAVAGEQVYVDNGDLYVDRAIVRKPDDLREALREPLVRSTFDATGGAEGWTPKGGGLRTYERPLYADEPTFLDERGQMEVPHEPRERAHDVYVTVDAARGSSVRVEWVDGEGKPANDHVGGVAWSRGEDGAESVVPLPGRMLRRTSLFEGHDQGAGRESVTVSLVDGVLRVRSPAGHVETPIPASRGHAVVSVGGAVTTAAIDRDVHYTQPPNAQFATVPENPFTVPPGHVFMLGDHSAYSRDSRFSALGPVPLDRVIGRVVFRVWPPSRIGTVR